MPVVLVTGTLDAALAKGLPPGRALTSYSAGPVVKVALCVTMAALALGNRHVPALDVGRQPRAARATAEITPGLAALADVSAFATTNPS